MEKRDTVKLFNSIAWIYQFFFSRQARMYSNKLKSLLPELNLDSGSKILDVGCGTGALASAFQYHQFEVLGVDNAIKMVQKAEKNDVNCKLGDVLKNMEIEKNSYDLVSAAFVIHALKPEKRILFMTEMQRISKNIVLLYDYGKKKKLITTILEKLEKGDYFNFIKDPTKEMNSVFTSVKRIRVSKHFNWYVCQNPKN